MRIRDTNVYVGPSLYAHFPVIRHTVELGDLEDWPTSRLPAAFVDALLDALPGLHEHGCSYGEPGGFVRRLREDEGTWLGHVMEHVAIELQNVAGLDVTFGKTRSTDEPGVYNVVYEYEERRVGLAAGDLAITLIHSLLPDDLRPAGALPDDFAFPDEKERLIRFAQRRAFGPSTSALVRAAEERDIPWLRLNEYSLVQFGHGSTSGASRRRSPARPATSRWRSRPTRSRPTRSYATWGCRCPSRGSSTRPPRRSQRRAASATRWW